MADGFPGVLLASVRMALAHQVPGHGPMTASEIATYLTLVNPNRPFHRSDVLAVLRGRPDLFEVAKRRMLGFGPPRWRLTGEPARASDGAPSEQLLAGAPHTDVDADQGTAGLDLIEDEAPPAAAAAASSVEHQALERERARRRAEQGRTVLMSKGKSKYRDVIDPRHPISRLDDQTLERLGSEQIPYIDSD